MHATSGCWKQEPGAPLRRASLYIDRDNAKADRLLGALLTRTLDAEVEMDPKALALRYFDVGYLTATFREVGVPTSFGPATNGNKLHAEAPGYPWLVRAYKLAEEARDMALGLALVTAGTRMSEHTMFLERAVKASEADDTQRNDLGIRVQPLEAAPVEGAASKKVPVKIIIPMDSLTLMPDGEDLTGKVSIFVRFARGDGAMSEVSRRTNDFRFPASTRGRRKELTIQTEFTLEQDVQRVSIGVVDELSQVSGFATYEP